MALSPETCDKHSAFWEKLFARSSYPYRRNWPARLFRHEPLESALAVINSGLLKSRNGAAGHIAHDVAPDDIIGANELAHDYVRLYFRPRTPTQWNIEGIREPSDFYHGKHAPVLFMFLFNAKKILTTPGVMFSDGNMQSGASQTSDNDANFAALDFASIYHEGPIPADQRDHVRRSRCAEVLCANPLVLNGNLEAVICRSDAERRLLLNELGPNFDNGDRVRVFKEPGIFNADFAFVESADLTEEGLLVRFHPPNRGAREGRVQVTITSASSNRLMKRWDQSLDLGKRWQFKADLEDGSYRIEILLRDCLAFRAVATLDSAPF